MTYLNVINHNEDCSKSEKMKNPNLGFIIIDCAIPFIIK